MQNVVRLLSTLALMGAVRNLAGPYEAETGARIDADFAPTLGLLDRLRDGCEARTRNLEIPRCAIAHLRSGPSDHRGMTGWSEQEASDHD
jgi:hypothetical protein